MIRTFNPDNVAPPLSRYSHGAESDAARWLRIAGQVGIKPDGTLAQGFAAQTERCWANLFAVLAGAGMTKRDLVKVTVFVTAPDRVALYREIRDRVLEGHAPAATYLVVAGLAHPDYLVEIEGVAAA